MENKVTLITRSGSNSYEARVCDKKFRFLTTDGEEAKMADAEAFNRLNKDIDGWLEEDAEIVEYVREQAELLGYEMHDAE